ncbi:MAG: hypoxanthine phosphoribosyltransferase [Sphingobacteriales bacterium]|nr:hypoxanthine phosphoribosyltransferase [Sphingobacteriales bacterium]
MSQTIQIKDKLFGLYLPESKIQERITSLASQLNKEYQDKNPVFISILNGSFFFAADLLKNFNSACEITFVRLASYKGLGSTGKVKILLGLMQNIKDRHVVIIEDIVDSGRTMVQMLGLLENHQAKSIKVATLLLKKEALVEDIEPDYVGFEVPNKFLVGYGLDYDEAGRNLRDLYILK